MKLLFLLFLPLILVACPPPLPAPSLPPGQMGQTPTLSGTAANWIGTSNTIKLEVQKGSGSSAVFEYLGSGSIDATGKFSIVLPGNADMNPYLELVSEAYKPTDCPSIHINPPNARDSFMVNLGVFDGAKLIGRLKLQPDQLNDVGDVVAALLFVDRASELNLTCKQNGLTNHLHAKLEGGWFYDLNELYAPNLAHEFVDALPPSIQWTYLAASGSPNAGHLGETPLLEGNVRDWVGEAATIKIILQKGVGASTEFDYFSSGTIDAKGDFKIRLPSGAEIAKYMTSVTDTYASTCPSIGVKPIGLKLSSVVQLAMFNPQGKQVGFAYLDVPDRQLTKPDDETGAAISYFDADGLVNGVCADSKTSVDVHSEVAKGWNVGVDRCVAFCNTGTVMVKQYREAIEALPTSMFWTYNTLGSNNSGRITGVSGQVNGWTNGTARVRVAVNDFSGPYLGSGEIDASGNFVLNLPTPLEITPYLTGLGSYYSSLACTSMNVFPSGLSAAFVNIAVLDASNKEFGRLILKQGLLDPPASGDVLARLVYFDKPATVTGDCTPNTSANASLAHVEYITGERWNWQVQAYASTSERSDYIYDPLALPSVNPKWVFYSTKP
jgi:hypothetical protein